MSLPHIPDTVEELKTQFRANYIARMVKNISAEIEQEQERITSANRRIAELNIMLEAFRAQQENK